MSNASFNEKVVPVIRPDPNEPGATVDREANFAGAVEPRLRPPETGFASDSHDDPGEAGESLAP